MIQKISPKIWIPAISVYLIAVGVAIFFSWPGENKLPEIVVPQVTPGETIIPPEGIVWNVSVGDVNPEAEIEIKKAIYNDPYFVSLTENLKKENELIIFESITIKEKCASVGYTFMYQESKEYIPTAGVTLVLKNVNGEWEKIGTFVYDFEIDYSQCRVIEGFE